ncbi:MAG TPA: DUF1330 domain-containing protein [Acidimicrobiia bacterium]|jgi:uncharacterized protein (DUF1330 family)|nr:DUF1330 domain-containing protein [Acidimicrobiia bacterium]
MSAIRPNRDQFTELAASTETGPVVMLNLLKFKAQATGEDGSGADAYKRYGDEAVKLVEEQGGRILWQGRADQILIGDPARDWDSVVLVEYPSRKAFLDMVSKPKYEAAHEHREAGLERTELVAMTEQFRSFGI